MTRENVRKSCHAEILGINKANSQRGAQHLCFTSGRSAGSQQVALSQVNTHLGTQ